MNKIKAFFSRIHISRKNTMPLWKKIVIKAGVVVGSFLLFGLITLFIAPQSVGVFYEELFYGTFRNDKTMLATLYQFALLFGVCVCLLPASRMKYWNLGVTGQVLVGCIGAFAVLNFGANKMPDGLLLFLMFISAVVCSVIWSVVPAIFKATFNTNETLFTLMMNYIAIALVKFFEKTWANNSTGGINSIKFGFGDWVKANSYTVYIIVAAIIIVSGVLITIYSLKTKHGYESTVVGQSTNTAKYVGINPKIVIVRTLALCGVECGLIAFLFTAVNHNLSTAFSGTGYGFTGVLTLWCGSFNPLLAALFSFLFIFVNKGVGNAAGTMHVSTYISGIYTSILFLLIIGSEFFINYKINIKKKEEAEQIPSNLSKEGK